MTKANFQKLFIRLFVVTLFFVIVAVTLFYAFGYRYDRESDEVVSTGILRVTDYLPQASLEINDERYSTSLPADVQYLSPGEYDVVIKRQGFNSWSKKVVIEAGKITEVKDIYVVPEDPLRYSSFLARSPEEDFRLFKGDYQWGYFTVGGLLSVFDFDDFGEVDSLNLGVDLGVGEGIRAYMTDSQVVIVGFAGNVFKFLDLQDLQLRSGFVLPTGAENVRIVDNQGFYVRDGRLFQFVLPGIFVGEEEKVIVGEMIYEGIDGFEVLDRFRQLFLLSYQNGSRGVGVLDYDQRRFEAIDLGVTGGVDISEDGNRLVYKKGNELWLYDFVKDSLKLLTRFSESVGHVNWINGERSLVFLRENTLMVCDVGFYNCFKLAEIDGELGYVYVEGENMVVYRKDGNFYGLDLSFSHEVN